MSKSPENVRKAHGGFGAMLEVRDENGNCLSSEEAIEYMNDVFDGGIPMSCDYLRDYLWPKWGERLGIPKPEPLTPEQAVYNQVMCRPLTFRELEESPPKGVSSSEARAIAQTLVNRGVFVINNQLKFELSEAEVDDFVPPPTDRDLTP